MPAQTDCSGSTYLDNLRVKPDILGLFWSENIKKQ